MKQRPRIYYTEAQKAMMWDRWSKGDTLHQIGKLFDRPHTSIQNILAATGGIRPPACHWSRLALALAEREEISRALAAGESIHAWLHAWVEPHPPSAVSFTATVARLATGLLGPTKLPGRVHTVPNLASWRAIQPWCRSWRANCSINGHRNRSQDCSNGLTPRKGARKCRTMPSIARSLSRRGAP